jgi:hypothetical protein
LRDELVYPGRGDPKKKREKQRAEAADHQVVHRKKDHAHGTS